METGEKAQVEKSIEISIEVAKKAIAKGEALERLFKNPDFKKIIMEDYFEKEPARLVGLLTDSEMQDESNQTGLKNDMIGVSVLRKHFIVIQRIANQMTNAVAQSEAELDSLRNESE